MKSHNFFIYLPKTKMVEKKEVKFRTLSSEEIQIGYLIEDKLFHSGFKIEVVAPHHTAYDISLVEIIEETKK